jgi:hypothetical protein
MGFTRTARMRIAARSLGEGHAMAFSWGSPMNWLLARRHLFATVFVDTTDQKRQRWVEMQARRTGTRDFCLTIPDLPAEFSFIALGDPGEGDASQLVLVDKFLKEAADTAFTMISSDVIYPSGRSHDYREKFYVPYRAYHGDIYAVPGNHDWYDELTGFMIHFCDNQLHFRDGIRSTVDLDKLAQLRAIRKNRVFQPNMYFYIDTPYVRIVCIDTGIKGRIDAAQERWLARVSVDPKPKILISGKPIYVDGTYNRDLANVDRIVTEHNYCLVIAGDTHNFQKYRVPVERNGQPHVVWHLVNGGGGAFLHRTHVIPPVDEMVLPVKLLHEPQDFECYPTRQQSETYYNSWWQDHAPDWAVDRDKPPYHKSFLKVSVRSTHLRIQVFRVEDFDPQWIDASPYREWEIPYSEREVAVSSVLGERSIPVA